MRVRFFADWGPNDVPRVLVGISPEDDDRGQAREAVHVCTQTDIDTYPLAYAEYLKTVPRAPGAMPPKASASADAEAPTAPDAGETQAAAETASSGTASSGGGSRSSRSSGSASGG